MSFSSPAQGAQARAEAARSEYSAPLAALTDVAERLRRTAVADIVASDARAVMVRRTQQLASEHGVDLRPSQSPWHALSYHLERTTFNMVFCAGNSLTHANGTSGRLAGLTAMSRLLVPGGRLVLASRTWELIRAGALGLT